MNSKFDEIIKFTRKLYNKPSGIIPLHEPVFLGNEKKYLADCIDSTFVSGIGKYIEIFEKKLAEFLGVKFVLATVNGTSALHISLLLAGVRSADEVITQALTFIATANSITYIGAQPVFLDVDKDTLGLSPEKLDYFLKKMTKYDRNSSRLINKRTLKPVTAVVPMHTFGHPCRIVDIVSICDSYGIPVIEDAAESIGSYYSGKPTGTFGKAGIISFNGNKTITLGSGGAIVTNDKDIYEKGKYLINQAKDPHPWEYFHSMIGYNFRCSNINAALGCAQIEGIENILCNKRETAIAYATFFDSNGIEFLTEPKYCKSNYWLNAIFLDNLDMRNEFLLATNKEGILTRPIWTLLSELPMYKKCQTDSLVNSKLLSDTIVNIPSSYRK